MKVYLFNEDFIYVGEGESIPHPFNIGEDSIPAGSTTLEPLEPKEGYNVVFVDSTEDIEAHWRYDKVLTEEEMKVAGKIDVTDGEYVQDDELITVESPSMLHTWNHETHVWELDSIKFNTYKNMMYSKISDARTNMVNGGIMFEETKLIKGRDSDITHANTVYTFFKDELILSTEWKFSNGLTEIVSTLDRMKTIYFAICSISSNAYDYEIVMKREIYAMTEADYTSLLAYDVAVRWGEVALTTTSSTVLVTPVVEETIEPTVTEETPV